MKKVLIFDGFILPILSMQVSRNLIERLDDISDEGEYSERLVPLYNAERWNQPAEKLMPPNVETIKKIQYKIEKFVRTKFDISYSDAIQTFFSHHKEEIAARRGKPENTSETPQCIIS